MNKNKIFVRQTNKSDINQIIDLLQSISEFRPDKNEYKNIFEEFSRQRNVYSFVAIIDNKIVGYGAIIIEIKIRGGKLGHIEDIVSDENYRRIGIGNAILQSLFDVARKSGCYKVALQCKDHNMIFYKKNGYSQSGVGMQRML